MRCRICDESSRRSKNETDMLCRSCLYIMEFFYLNGVNHRVD